MHNMRHVGQANTEYALILGLVSLTGLLGLIMLGGNLSRNLSQLAWSTPPVEKHEHIQLKNSTVLNNSMLAYQAKRGLSSPTVALHSVTPSRRTVPRVTGTRALGRDKLDVQSLTSFYAQTVNTGKTPAEINSIIQVGNKYLTTPLMSVTTSNKALIAPADPHNYVSLSPYSWPNPNTPNGLPYIIKDGQRNPALSEYKDFDNLRTLQLAVSKLTEAYQVTGDEKYSKKAIELLEYWFINPSTRMNPNLSYAQIVPGKNGNLGNPAGIIDTFTFADLAQTIIVLESSLSASSTFKSGMKEWFTSYLDWMTTSPNGRSIAAGHNNQKTWYTAQVISIQQAIGQPDLAIATLQDFMENELPLQLGPSGPQLEEVNRTKGFDYSVFNLTGLFKIADIAKTLDVDLWHYKIDTRSSFALKVALDYLIPFATAQKSWPYPQIVAADIKSLSILMDKAKTIYPYAEASYSASQANLKAFSTTNT